MSQNYDIIIVGAGLAGAPLALWLAKHTTFRLALIERAKPQTEITGENQRVVALGKTAQEVLSKADVFDRLGHKAAYPYKSMFVWDENSAGELEFSAEDSGLEQLGFMVDAQVCTRELHTQLLENERIDCYFDYSPQALQSGSDQNRLITDKGEFTAHLVVAADGAGSWVRQQARIFANHHTYDQSGIVALIHTGESHNDCAWQRFLSTGPIAVLPVHGNQSSIVWSADNETAERLIDLPDEEFAQELGQALQGRLGKIEMRSARKAFPLKSQRAERYYRRGIVLVGDAAHSIHPLAGQGANLGFKDVLELGRLLQSAKGDIGDPKLLETYQRRRKSDNEQTDRLMSALHVAYRNNSAAWMVMRGLGMNWIDRSRMIRTLLANQAMGI